MDLTDEQWSHILSCIIEVNAAALMMDDDISIDYRHPKKEQQLFDLKLHTYDPEHKPHIIAARVGKRVAVALLAALIAASVTLTVSAAAREWFFKVISEIFPTHTQIDYEPANSEQMELVFVPYAPTFLPDGYTAFDGPKIFSETRRVAVRYENGNGGHISFSQTFSGGLNIDTEDAETELLQVSGHDAFYIRKGDWKSLNWEAENARFLLSVDDSSLDKDDIVAIAESIAPVTMNK